MSEIAIQFNQFSFQYHAQKEPTLVNLNFTIRKGEKVAIIGPSGSGKSTVGHCLNGLIPNYYHGEMSGELLIFGQPITSIFEASKHVGTVLQDQDAQFIALSVKEDIAFSLENDGMEVKKMHQEVNRIANIVGIESLLELRPQDLSGGQKQKVSLAGVMVNDAKIVLYDEPLANLDPLGGQKAIELIDQLHHENQLTTIIIEHRLEEVLHRPIDRIIMMDHGKIIADLTPDQLLKSQLLEEHSIRVPLYVSALKYAGCDLSKIDDLANLEAIDFNLFYEPLHKWSTKYAPVVTSPKEDLLLKVSDLSFSYDEKPLLRNIDLEVFQHELVSVVGANGAGKSTLSKVICGFEKQKTGSIYLNDELIDDMSIAKRGEKIGFVLQNPNAMISKHLVSDEITLGLKLRGFNENEIDKRLKEALDICGLYPFRNWPIGALSYGQKKRVTIASILVLKPQLLIVDEPTAGQDYAHYHEIMTFLKDISQQGVSIIFITHDMHLMLEYTTRTCVFSQGELLAVDRPEKILAMPELLRRANLKQTSLQLIEQQCHFPYQLLVRAMIAYEREVTVHG